MASTCALRYARPTRIGVPNSRYGSVARSYRGHRGKPGPLGSPLVANRIQARIIAEDSCRSAGVGAGWLIKLGLSREAKTKGNSSEWVAGSGPPPTCRVNRYANVLG